MRGVLVAGALIAASVPAFSQVGSGKLTFEAASVKRAGPFEPGHGARVLGGPGTDDPGRITFTRATFADLVRRAYDIRPDEVLGPDWINDRGPSTVYTVTATMAPGTTKQQFQQMMQNLLTERFHLVLHHEKQTRPGYELVVASGGPKLKEWTPGSKTELPPAFDRLGPGVTRIDGHRTMADLCRGLGASIAEANGTYQPAGPVPRVVDHTGLPGDYRIALVFTTSPGVPGGANDTPDLFTAIEKQLGLKLRRLHDVQVDVLIVDKADRIPTEN